MSECKTCGLAYGVAEEHGPEDCIAHLVSARDEATEQLKTAREHLTTVVDEAFGMQPVMTLEELISTVEREAYARRVAHDETTRELERAKSELEVTRGSQ